MWIKSGVLGGIIALNGINGQSGHLGQDRHDSWDFKVGASPGVVCFGISLVTVTWSSLFGIAVPFESAYIFLHHIAHFGLLSIDFIVGYLFKKGNISERCKTETTPTETSGDDYPERVKSGHSSFVQCNPSNLKIIALEITDCSTNLQ